MKKVVFNNKFVTKVPTECLIEDYQMILTAMSIEDKEERDSRLNTVLECIAESIDRFTEVPAGVSVNPSPSSIIAMGVDNGILCHADGTDIHCIAGKPVSLALSGGVCQCNETCPYWGECCPDSGIIILESSAEYQFDNPDAEEACVASFERKN